ncbi:MAG: hypothetical protein WA324_27735 [Bryobacteraceae bacterium]
MGIVIDMDKFKDRKNNKFSQKYNKPFVPHDGYNFFDAPQPEKIYKDKADYLIHNKCHMPEYIEYVSLTRYHQQQNPQLKIDTYPEWIKKLVEGNENKAHSSD